MTSSNLSAQLQKDAEEIARGAIDLLAKLQDKATVANVKSDTDMATTADLASEKFITDAIKRLYPEHRIVAEESGAYKPEKSVDYEWIVDPLDGTKEYARGAGDYACLLAIEKNGELEVGVTMLNELRNLFSARKGNGATLNGKAIHASPMQTLQTASVGLHFPSRASNAGLFDFVGKITVPLIENIGRLRPGWNDAKMLGAVAAGYIDAWIIATDLPRWHDIAPGLILVSEAGGRVTTLKNNPVTKSNYETEGILASNALIHDELMTLISKYF